MRWPEMGAPLRALQRCCARSQDWLPGWLLWQLQSSRPSSGGGGCLLLLARSCPHRQLGKQLVKRDRVVPYSCATRVVDRIRNRGGGAANAELTDTLALERI